MGPLERRFFVGWFVVFTLVIFLSDSCGLRLGFWPPAPFQELAQWYSDNYDPLFFGPPWHRAALAIELVVFPPYHYLAIRRLLGGGKYSDLTAYSAVYVTCIVYSIVVIFSENFLGEAGVVPPNPALYLTLYLPFPIVSVLWGVRVSQAIREEAAKTP